MTLTVPGRKRLALVGGQFLERLQRLLRVNFGFGIGFIRGQIYLAGGPALSKLTTPAGQVKLYLAHKLTTLAGQVKLYLAHKLPAYGPGPLMVETIPRPKQSFDFPEGPGVYHLTSTSLNGRASDCPPVTVIVQVGKTTRTAVPWGCDVK